jgi:hypothetical protein
MLNDLCPDIKKRVRTPSYSCVLLLFFLTFMLSDVAATAASSTPVPSRETSSERLDPLLSPFIIAQGPTQPSQGKASKGTQKKAPDEGQKQAIKGLAELGERCYKGRKAQLAAHPVLKSLFRHAGISHSSHDLSDVESLAAPPRE